MTTASPRAAQLDTVIEKGILFLLLFTPLVFGAVHDWSIGVMEMTAFLIFGAWLSKMALAGRVEIVKTPLLALTAALITLVALQLVPLPRTLLTLLTPQTSRIYNDVFGEAGWNWRTISIYPGATGEELLKLLAYAAIFFVIINHYRTKEQVLTILRTIVLMACFLVVFAVVQKLTWNGRLFWFYPIDPALLSRVSRIRGQCQRQPFCGLHGDGHAAQRRHAPLPAVLHTAIRPCAGSQENRFPGRIQALSASGGLGHGGYGVVSRGIHDVVPRRDSRAGLRGFVPDRHGAYQALVEKEDRADSGFRRRYLFSRPLRRLGTDLRPLRRSRR